MKYAHASSAISRRRTYSPRLSRPSRISGAANWGLCAAILAVACVGKFVGGAAAARFSGIGWRDSAALAVLMNTRGLVELVVLNIGFDLGIISPTLFTMLVIMALVTTFMTSPLLMSLLRRNPWLPQVLVTNGPAKARSA